MTEEIWKPGGASCCAIKLRWRFAFSIANRTRRFPLSIPFKDMRIGNFEISEFYSRYLNRLGVPRAGTLSLSCYLIFALILGLGRRSKCRGSGKRDPID